MRPCQECLGVFVTDYLDGEVAVAHKPSRVALRRQTIQWWRPWHKKGERGMRNNVTDSPWSKHGYLTRELFCCIRLAV